MKARHLRCWWRMLWRFAGVITSTRAQGQVYLPQDEAMAHAEYILAACDCKTQNA